MGQGSGHRFTGCSGEGPTGCNQSIDWAAFPSGAPLGKNPLPTSFKLVAELTSLWLYDGGLIFAGFCWRSPSVLEVACRSKKWPMFPATWAPPTQPVSSWSPQGVSQLREAGASFKGINLTNSGWPFAFGDFSYLSKSLDFCYTRG